MNKSVAVLASLLAAGLLAIACSSDPAPKKPGDKCSSDGDCPSDLKCLDYVATTSGGCQVLGQQCSKVCTTDDDCKIAAYPDSRLKSCKSTCGTIIACQQ